MNADLLEALRSLVFACHFEARRLRPELFAAGNSVQHLLPGSYEAAILELDAHLEPILRAINALDERWLEPSPEDFEDYLYSTELLPSGEIDPMDDIPF